MRKTLAILLAGFVLAGCGGQEKSPEPEFSVKDCSEETSAQIEDAVSQVCDAGLRHMVQGDVLTRGQQEIFRRICGLSVSLTVKCKDCTEEDPNPCAYSQPDLPLLQGEAQVTTARLLEELRSKGGITIFLCKNADGSVPSANCAGVVHKTRDLRTILLHELNHFAINHPTHSSTSWGHVEEVNWDEQ
jgi:hypothetical protein